MDSGVIMSDIVSFNLVTTSQWREELFPIVILHVNEIGLCSLWEGDMLNCFI